MSAANRRAGRSGKCAAPRRPGGHRRRSPAAGPRHRAGPSPPTSARRSRRRWPASARPWARRSRAAGPRRPSRSGHRTAAERSSPWPAGRLAPGRRRGAARSPSDRRPLMEECNRQDRRQGPTRRRAVQRRAVWCAARGHCSRSRHSTRPAGGRSAVNPPATRRVRCGDGAAPLVPATRPQRRPAESCYPGAVETAVGPERRSAPRRDAGGQHARARSALGRPPFCGYPRSRGRP